MKTVLFAAAGSLFLAFAAHAAQPEGDAPQAAVTQAAQPNVPAVGAVGTPCIDGAAVTPTAYSTDEDAESDGSCTRFLSTQTLVQPPLVGRT